MKKNKIFGLDISDKSVEAIQLKKGIGKPKMTAYARTILGSSLVTNGEIKNSEKLAEKFKALLESAQPRRIKSKYCVVSIPESQVFTAIFSLPAGLKHKEIQQTIPFKAEEVIPFKSSEVYFDFKVIAKTKTSQEIFYVAVPAKVIDKYVETLKLAGLIPVAFDLESISLSRAVLTYLKKKEGPVAILDIGSRTTNLNIFDRNGIRHSAVIKIAGNKFTAAVAKAEGKTAKEAESLKVKNGFSVDKQSKKALTALQREGKKMVSEINKQLEFYQAKHQTVVSRIVLAGGSSLLPGFDQYLADSLTREVVVAEPLQNLRNSLFLGKFKDKSSLFANVIGLGLRGVSKKPAMGDINLLPIVPSEFLIVPKKEDKSSWIKVAIRFFVLLILAGVLGWILMMRQSGVDIYQNVMPKVDSNPNIQVELSDSDLIAIEELRKIFLESGLDFNTSTPTSTPEGISEPEEVRPALGQVRIKETSLGYLNVRQGPATSFDKVAEASSGLTYPFVAQENDWYEIQVNTTTSGWVYSVFVDLVN